MILKGSAGNKDHLSEKVNDEISGSQDGSCNEQKVLKDRNDSHLIPNKEDKFSLAAAAISAHFLVGSFGRCCKLTGNGKTVT